MLHGPIRLESRPLAYPDTISRARVEDLVLAVIGTRADDAMPARDRVVANANALRIGAADIERAGLVADLAKPVDAFLPDDAQTGDCGRGERFCMVDCDCRFHLDASRAFLAMVGPCVAIVAGLQP